MIKVFLAEDEAVLRRGIRNEIAWEQYGFEFVGDASDGEYAYPLILQTEPDILITDVKMPFMDGLELSRLVRKKFPQLKILILSGYDDFCYAREGIELGISNYLLKPVTAERLIEELQKVAGIIREEQTRNRLLERYFISFEKYTEFLDRSDYSGADRELIQTFLKLGSIEECDKFVEEYFAAVGCHNYRSMILRQYIAMDIYFCVQEFIRGLGGSDGRAGIEEALQRLPGVIHQVEDTKAYIRELLRTALARRDTVSEDRYGKLMEAARAYIEQHFAEHNFSLNIMAEHVGVSPSYFSSIFKQETGQTFTEYLTERRIDKACELLRCTSLRSSEIGERIGYADPHYFSATFKKIKGQTPTEYKNMR